MSRTSPAAEATLARAAARQRGLFTREQALAAGLSDRAIEYRLADRSWIPVRRGVYRSTYTPATWHQRALATCIGRGAALALSHEAAAYVRGLIARAPGELDVVTGPRRSGAGVRALARVHRVAVEELDRQVVDGIPVTGSARTLSDLAARFSRRALAEAVDQAIFCCPTVRDRRRLLSALSHFAESRRPGAPALRAACASWRSDDHAAELASALEVEVLRLVLGSGLPEPVCQHRVGLRDGGVALLDFAWPAERVALEVDGFRFHSDRGSFDADRRRGNALVALGWQVLRTTAPQVRGCPTELLGSVAAALGRGTPAAGAGTVE